MSMRLGRFPPNCRAARPTVGGRVGGLAEHGPVDVQQRRDDVAKTPCALAALLEPSPHPGAAPRSRVAGSQVRSWPPAKAAPTRHAYAPKSYQRQVVDLVEQARRRHGLTHPYRPENRLNVPQTDTDRHQKHQLTLL